MSTYSLSRLSDPVLLRALATYVARGWANTAIVLAHIAEVDARRLYVAEGHPSMFSYCVHVLHFSDDAAYKRIQAARAARQFPALFDAVAQGRLHLTAVNLLAPHLASENADELLTAATHKTKSKIEFLLAERFPRPDVPTLVQPLASAPALPVAAGPGPGTSLDQLAPAQVEPAPRDRVMPLSAEGVLLKVTLDRRTHDKLCQAQALLGHQVRTGDIASVLDRALDALIAKLEKRKFAATDKPRASHRRSMDPRHIPASVKRAVWERDGGQCTFVSGTGQRCPARTRLEFDHVLEVARGGGATVAGIRLRCRAHNQYAAECTFGAGFMRRKREARRAAADRARTAVATARVPAPDAPSAMHTRGAQSAPSPMPASIPLDAAVRPDTQRVPGPVQETAEHDVVPWLRRLGFRAEEAREAAAYCATVPEASLDDRMRVALGFLRPRARREVPFTRTSRPAS